MSRPSSHEFSAAETRELLAVLDERLRDRGVAAAVFIVGGAAIAATGARGDRLTQDVDALTDSDAVLDEAQALARERSLPHGWLNRAAAMWMPPLPSGALDPPASPGLRVTFADDGFLLATKLIAQRAKDADDLVALAQRAGLGSASAQQLEAHIRSYYTDEAMLEFIIDGTDVDGEITLLSQDAAHMLARASAANETEAPADSAQKLRRGTAMDHQPGREIPPHSPGPRPT